MTNQKERKKKERKKKWKKHNTLRAPWKNRVNPIDTKAQQTSDTERTHQMRK